MFEDDEDHWDPEDYPAFVGECECIHNADAHGWGACGVDGCVCEAGWVD